MVDLDSLIVGAILGTLFSIVTTTFIEWRRRPKLRIRRPDNPDKPNLLPVSMPPLVIRLALGLDMALQRAPKDLDFRHLEVVNKATWSANKPVLSLLSKAWSAMVQRQSATNCHGNIRIEGTRFKDKPIPIRWCNTPLPGDAHRSETWRYFLPIPVDVLPGDTQKFEVAGRFNVNECYALTPQAYLRKQESLKGLNPDYELALGQYKVEVEIGSADGGCKGTFRLINQPDEFRIEPWDDDQSQRKGVKAMVGKGIAIAAVWISAVVAIVAVVELEIESWTVAITLITIFLLCGIAYKATTKILEKWGTESKKE